MSEQPKSAAPAQEHSYPAPAIVPYSHQPASFPPPGPGGYAPPIFGYPPPPDGNHPEGQNGTAPPYVIPFPPGLVYAYPPHPQPPGFGPPPPSTPSSSAVRPKRKQVKMACTHCANACKRCDESRPCERCVKYGTADTCQDGIRKERKKGIKRGPYKRKAKEPGEEGSYDSSEWPNGQPPAPASPPPPPPPTAPYAPEGYYHIYYPPGAFIPHPPEGQPGSEAPPPQTNGQQPVMPYFIPGPYPPFHYPQLYPHPPPPGSVPPQPPTNATSSHPTPSSQTSGQQQVEQPTTINPADTSRIPDGPPAGAENAVVDPALAAPVVAGKKRSRKTGEQRSKKAKTGGISLGEEASEPQPAISDGGDNRP